MDMFAAEAVVELSKQHPEVILEMVSPFDDQASKWPEEYRARHDLLFELADITTATSHIYTKSAMLTVISSIMPTCCLPPMTASRAGQL